MALVMEDIDGVLYRPEDAKAARKRAEGRSAEPVAPDMLDIDGVLYRPEDAKALGLVSDDDDADLSEDDFESTDDDSTMDDELVDIVPPSDPAVITSKTAQGVDHDGPDDDSTGRPGEADGAAEPVKRERRRR